MSSEPAIDYTRKQHHALSAGSWLYCISWTLCPTVTQSAHYTQSNDTKLNISMILVNAIHVHRLQECKIMPNCSQCDLPYPANLVNSNALNDLADNFIVNLHIRQGSFKAQYKIKHSTTAWQAWGQMWKKTPHLSTVNFRPCNISRCLTAAPPTGKNNPLHSL